MLPGFLRDRRRQALAAGALVVLAAAGALAAPLFLPKATTEVQQPLPGGPGAMPVLLRQGSFRDGDAAHHAQGTVALYRAADGTHFLRFEGYQATPGPDVYFYLTPAPDARTTAEVEGGLRLAVPGGDEDGEATLRGTFHVPLPAGLDPAAYQGVAAWCDRFDVLFGNAALA